MADKTESAAPAKSFSAANIITGGTVLGILVVVIVLVIETFLTRSADAEHIAAMNDQGDDAALLHAASAKKLKTFGTRQDVATKKIFKTLAVDRAMELVVTELKQDPTASSVPALGSQDQASVKAPLEDPEPRDLSVAKVEASADMKPEDLGKALFTAKTCAGCHSIDGSRRVGPSFKGVIGRKEKLADGTTITVDEAYVIESLMDPNAKVVEGYPPTMPVFKGQLSDKEVAGLIAYLKTL